MAGTRLHRFHSLAFDPVHFDRGQGGRLNAPDGSYGVLHVASTVGGAFAETFLRRPGRTLLPPGLIAAKAHATVLVGRELRVVRLHGNGLGRLGCTAEVTHSGLPYDLPQAWSKALHDHPTKPDGIAYRARHDDDQLCYAIFDGDGTSMSVGARDLNLEQDWFYALAGRYGIGAAPPAS